MDSIFEERLKAIQSMPEGPAKQQAIADLSRDYAGRTERAQGNLRNANSELAQAMTMPQARTAGPSQNPFAVAVAPNPMEFLAQGLRGYNAVQDRKGAMSALEDLSQGQERGLGAVMSAAMSPEEEEEERLRRMRLGLYST